MEWRSLREIEVGVCDGLSYDAIRDEFPAEYKARENDKLRYRYPRGESYMDIISRLESVIFGACVRVRGPGWWGGVVDDVAGGWIGA